MSEVIRQEVFKLNESIEVLVSRKKIRKLYLRVYPPHGIVKASVPLRSSQSQIKDFIQKNSSWVIKKQEQARKVTPSDFPKPEPKPKWLQGDLVFFEGQSYPLAHQLHRPSRRIRPPKLDLENNRVMMEVGLNWTAIDREHAMTEWYRAEMKARIPALLEKWEPIVNRQAHQWGVKKMRTKWGSCNITDKRIWLSLELMKYPAHCLEYVLVHELLHLHERHHNKRFYDLMSQFYPSWKISEQVLNQALLP